MGKKGKYGKALIEAKKKKSSLVDMKLRRSGLDPDTLDVISPKPAKKDKNGKYK